MSIWSSTPEGRRLCVLRSQRDPYRQRMQLEVWWVLMILGLLTVRRFDVTALGRVISMRAVVLLTILLAVVSMARDPMFRQLLLLALAASLSIAPSRSTVVA